MPFKEKDIRYIQTNSEEYIDGNTIDILFIWGVNNFGFGTMKFFYKDDKLMCDNGTLSKEQIKMLLCKFVDDAEFIC